MIKITQPCIEIKGDEVYLIASIEDEFQSIKEKVFYKASSEYGQYLTEEVADAFVVGMLLPAARYDEDIYVDGAISEKLFYNINNSVLYILSLVWGHRVKLKAKKLISLKNKPDGVGCGCSLGIDSFAAMLEHMDGKSSQSYDITHLTYFNVGAMGYVNLEVARNSYLKDLQMVHQYALKKDRPVVCLESNFSIMYKDFNFDQSGDIRNFSAVLSLQKLFGKYLYGSSYPIKDFKFEQSQTGYYETLLAPLLSTEICELIIANPDMSRVDKTKYIVKNKDAQNYLYVCWKELIANKNPNSVIAKVKDNYLNCTRCDKCLRTLLAIDILGEINNFNKIFDIHYYYKVKDAYIAKVIYNRKNNAFYDDLYNLIKEYDYKLSSKTQIILFMYRYKMISIYSRLSKLLKCK